MKHLLLPAFVFLFFSAHQITLGQAGNSVQDNGNLQATAPYQERLYLHINSSFLLVGESLFFKTYCFSSTNNMPSPLSTIAYVALINEQASPVLEAKVLLKDGKGSGDFFLPSTLISGNYTLVAYTHWMKNYPVQDFFKKQVTIINPFRKPDNLPKKKTPLLQVDFFPEGGNLVSDVTGVVGFQVKDENKIGAVCKGKVLDEEGNIVTEFSSFHNGIGRFNMTPLAGKEYKAVIIDSLQNMYFQALPKVGHTIISMHVTEEESAFHITLRKKGIDKSGQVKIIARQDGNWLFDMDVPFHDEEADCQIKKSSLPFGISQLTVISSKDDVVCDRFIFNAPLTNPALLFTLNKMKYQTRESVRATIVMRDTMLSSVSVSVRKTEKQITYKPGISNYVWLNDLSNDLNLSNKSNLDDQMLVRKPMPYPVKDQLTNPSFTPKYLPEVRNNLITGIVKTKDNTTVRHEKVYLSIPSPAYIFLVSITDSTGRFYFNTDEIKSDADVILQVAPGCIDCQIKLDDNRVEDYTYFTPGPLQIDSSYRKIIEQSSIQTQIENAYYSQKQDSILDIPETYRFYGRPDKTYFLDDYVRFPTMEDILIEYIPEIILRKKENEFEIRAMNLRKREAFSLTPLILLDGIPIFDINQIMSYSPALLNKIEIVGKHYFYGPLDTHGIISLTTYDGTARDVSVVRKEKYMGIQPHKIYYSPQYNKTPTVFSTIPDFRRQLYWNPDITLSGKPLTFEFFTSDITGDFEIIIEGIRQDGLPVQHREVIHVEEK